MPTSSRATNMEDGNQDSYLKRYYRSLPEGKRLMMEKSLMNAVNEQAHVSGLEKGHIGGPTQVPDPQKTPVEHRNGADAEDSEGNNPKEPSSKKSSTCIVL